MNKSQKEEQISFFKKIFSNLKFVIISKINNIDSNNINELRRQLHANKIHFKVIKNKLLKIAAEKQNISIINKYIEQSTAIAWGLSDPIKAAQIFIKFQKHIDKIIIKGGFYNKNILSINAIEKLSKTPNLLISKINIMSLIKFIPATLLLRINTPAENIIFMIKQKYQKNN